MDLPLLSAAVTRLGFSYKEKVALPSKIDIAEQAAFINILNII